MQNNNNKNTENMDNTKKKKNRKILNILKIEIFLLFITTILTITIVAINKNQKSKNNNITTIKNQQNQEKKENRKKGNVKKDYEERYEEYDEDYEEQEEKKKTKEKKLEKNNKNSQKKENKKDKEKSSNTNYKIEKEEIKPTNSATQNDWNIISEFTTKMETEREKEKNRKYNIKLAAKYLNNIVVPAGETFSFHKNIWDEGKSKNYRYADTLTQNGMDKGLGGGVCQVSTTLFNAVLKTPNLRVTERKSHSEKVNYAPLGRDAVYVTGAKDFRFQNTRKNPIIIKTHCEENTLTVRICGIKQQSDYKTKIKINEPKKIKSTSDTETYNVLVETMYDGNVISYKNYESCYKKRYFKN